MSGSVTLEERLQARRELPAPKMRRALREAAGVSLREVADEVGVSASAVAHWELGERYPRAANLVAYARALQLLREAAE